MQYQSQVVELIKIGGTKGGWTQETKERSRSSFRSISMQPHGIMFFSFGDQFGFNWSLILSDLT
jgi:hypothetical protein